MVDHLGDQEEQFLSGRLVGFGEDKVDVIEECLLLGVPGVIDFDCIIEEIDE